VAEGLVPVLEATILRAIELNGAAIDMNKNAFLWGPRGRGPEARGSDCAPKIAVASTIKLSESLDEMIGAAPSS
jgi:indolepyruvate ferredoxin oxidoreductase